MANDFASDANCVALWRFEDEACVADSKGTNTLSNNGVVRSNTQYKEGDYAAYLTNDTLAIAVDDLSADFPFKPSAGNRNGSVAMWIYPGAIPIAGAMHLYFAQDYAGVSYGLAIVIVRPSSNGYTPIFRAYCYLASGHIATAEISAADITVGTNKWYHVAAAWDNNSYTLTIRAYDATADAAYSNSDVDDGYNSLDYTTGKNIVVAKSVNPAYVDEIVVFKDTLTADEIDAIRGGMYIPAGSPSASISDTPSSSASSTVSASPSFTTEPVILSKIPQFPFDEHLIWQTDIVGGADGTEQRIALRDVPRQQFTYSYPLPADQDSTQMENLLHYAANGLWYIPLWGERIKHTAALAAAETSISIATTGKSFQDDSDGVGNYAIVWQANQWEVVTVATVAADELTVSPLANSYSGTKFIAPCRMGYLLNATRSERHAGGAAVMTMVFEVIDNVLIEGHSASTTYEGVEVITTPGRLPGDVGMSSVSPTALIVDSATGRRTLRAVADYPQFSRSHRFIETSAADIWSRWQWLHYIAGRQKSFLVPTFRADMTLAANYSSADLTVDVVHRDFTTYIGSSLLRRFIAFLPSGSDPVVRRVISITEVDSTTERLTLNAAAGIDYNAGGRLCWVDQCRLASDTVTIQWQKPGLAIIDVDLVHVPKDSSASSPSASISASPSQSTSASPSQSLSASLSASPSASISSSPSVSVSASASEGTPSASISASPSTSLSASISASPSVSVSASASEGTPSASISGSPSASASASPSSSAS